MKKKKWPFSKEAEKRSKWPTEREVTQESTWVKLLVNGGTMKGDGGRGGVFLQQSFAPLNSRGSSIAVKE